MKSQIRIIENLKIKKMKFTSSSDELNKFCSEITQNSNYVAIDTEFIRVNTYFPELCLLQLAYKKNNEKNILVLDVFKKEINYKPFIDILKNNKITKVFHAGRQDCEIFLNLFSFLPQNIFDTQVAAMVCGIGDQESYENLAMNFLSIKIDKTYQFMDWSKRPLSKSQINYAANDVFYLCDIYEKQKDLLKKLNRNNWIIEENQKLTKKNTYDHNLRSIYKKIRFNKTSRNKDLIFELLDMREKIAKKYNLPRNQVIKDVNLINLIKKLPIAIEDFETRPLFSKNELKDIYTKQIFTIIKSFLNKEKIESSVIKEPNEKLLNLINLLKILLKFKCNEYKIPTRLIASNQDLEDLILNENYNIPALKGWRFDVFGNDAIRLKNGEIALYIGKQGLDLNYLNK